MGVCVGMQMLLDHSEEQDRPPGLGLIAGEVRALPARRPAAARRQPLQGAADGLEPRAPGAAAPALGTACPTAPTSTSCTASTRAPSDPRHSAGETDYGARFTCALARDNIFATQFHPEKSADHGLALYRNFLHWKP